MWRKDSWDRKIRKLIEQYKIAGLAVAVSNKEGIIWHNAYGVTSVEKPWDHVTTDTLFRIASCTKLTVGILTMKLVEQGKLDLDVPITNYIPWLHMADESTLDRITLRRLLSHSAGLPSEYTPDGPHDEDKLEEVLREGVAQLYPICDPDDKLYYYCNWGIRLVSYVLQSIMGEPFTSLIKKYILEPLGMKHTTFTLCEAATFSLAVPHKVGPEALHFIPVNATRHAAGGLFSTVDDMAKLGRVLLNNGEPLIKEAYMAMMMTPETNLYLNYGNDYGLTMRLKQYKDILICGHDGQSPPYYASIWAVPEKGYCVTVALNTEGGNILSTNTIPELIFDELFDLDKKWTRSRPGIYRPEEEQKYVGKYLGDSQGLFEFKVKDSYPCIVLHGKEYMLSPLDRPGVYCFTKDTEERHVGLPGIDEGKESYVGLPGIDGGSFNHIMVDSMLCRRVNIEKLPDGFDLSCYTGNFGTVMEHFTFTCDDKRLYLKCHGSSEYHPCQYVNGETFSCCFGVVIFVRINGQIKGVRIGSSFTFNKV